MQNTIQYLVLVILFLITFVTIFQLRTKVSALESNSDLASAASIADIKSSASTALTTAKSANDAAVTAQSAQTAFSSGFTVSQVLPTFQVGPSLTSVQCTDSTGGVLILNPSPNGKLSLQLVINTASGHENDPSIYFDMTLPSGCTKFTDWTFFASSTFDDSDLDEVFQYKITQTSTTTFRVRYVGNGQTTNYARLTLSGAWKQ